MEVKSTLTKDKLKKAMFASDGIVDFVRTQYIQNLKIARYIFAFNSPLKFPQDYFDSIYEFYENDIDGQMPIELRIDFTKARWPSDASGELASIDGIFVLGVGAILRKIRGYDNDRVKFIFEAFELSEGEEDHVYTFFEHTLNTVINSPSNAPGLYYSKQPGLFSMMQKVLLKRPRREGTMVYPYSEDILSVYTEMAPESLYQKMS